MRAAAEEIVRARELGGISKGKLSEKNAALFRSHQNPAAALFGLIFRLTKDSTLPPTDLELLEMIENRHLIWALDTFKSSVNAVVTAAFAYVRERLASNQLAMLTDLARQVKSPFEGGACSIACMISELDGKKVRKNNKKSAKKNTVVDRLEVAKKIIFLIRSYIDGEKVTRMPSKKQGQSAVVWN